MDTEQYQFYKNAQYTNTRNEKKTLIISVEDGQSDSTLGSTGEFSLDLFEPLKIDKHSEVYLDNFISVNSNTSLGLENSGFCLRINEFNIQTNVASYDDNEKNTIFNSIVIPNENNVPENYYGAVSHKGKKFNYVCDINPTTLHSLSGKITNLDGSSAFHGGPDGTVFTYALTGISNLWAGAGHATALSEGEQIVNIYINNQGDNFLTGVAAIPATNPPADAVDAADYGTVLAGQITNSPTIIFTAKADLIARGLNPATGDTVYMKIDGREYQFSGNLHVLKQNARFIAEFSIVAKN